MEKWKRIKNYDNYEVSSFGNIRRNNKLLSLKHKPKGYVQVQLCKNNVVENCSAHRLVANAFIEKIKNKDTVNHLDGNRSNNNVNNLEWCNNSENILHGYYENKDSRIRPITQFDLNGNVLMEHNSVRKAARSLGKLVSTNIQCALRGHSKTAYGFKWEYKQ